MNKNIPAFLISTLSFVMLSCNNSTSSNANENEVKTDSIYPPVETNPANTSYKPFQEGQTRAPGIKTVTDFTFSIVTEQLESPWGMALLPDGRLLITEKAGTLRILSNEGALSNKIDNLPKVDPEGQGGLLGITIDPNFASNRMIYWVFVEPTPEGNHTAVAKGKLSEDETRVENAEIIYRATPTYKGKLHYGGRIIFDKTGNLLVTTGERSDIETRPQAQDLNSALGKIIRITTEGKPAEGNPFINTADAKPEIYTYGHRNIQGIAIHPTTGDIWETEFGPRGGDELNRIEAGKNYGWPVITYGLEYSGKEIGTPPIQVQEGMEQPVYYWDPVLSPSGLMFYTSDEIPEWKNSLFIGGLSSTHIARIVIKDNKVVGEERILDKEGQRFRDVIQGKNGEIFTITDAGRLYKISKK